MKQIKNVFFIALMIWLLCSIDSNAATGKVTTEGTRIRKEANTSSVVLAEVNNGETIEVIAKDGEWYKVKYNEEIGYIRNDLIEVNDEELKESENIDNTTSDTSNENQNENASENNRLSLGEKQVISDTVCRIVPCLSASHLGEVKAGDKVTVIKVMNSWSCIKNSDNKAAWIPSSLLKEVSKEEEKPVENTKKIGYISVSAAVIRKGPSTSTEALAEARRNKQIEIIAEEGDWYKIIYNDMEAYVAKRLVSDRVTNETSRSGPVERAVQSTNQESKVEKSASEIAASIENADKEKSNTQSKESNETKKNTETTVKDTQSDKKEETSSKNAAAVTSSKGEEVVATAKKYLGCSYVYGGAGPSSFDCSGFTQYIYKQFGISLAHGAISQSNAGTYVSKDKLQPGDLVIFRDWDNKSIGHCGIYIGGRTIYSCC